ncbi:SpoIIE family protein phosphatase [Desulfonatronospira sp.]|uniref:PP2C family protein-serine/threonine phosphatase n=1 Tax=Desulfonatronospira sp. TaxID=1962951 RepID=UPI0025BB725C|nr:SpoIIE family protein phosphatase [Desulfonatronospira sp.]
MKKVKLLIAEDSSINRKFLVRLLSDEFEIKESSDGGEAVEMFASFAPDIILLDIHMPVMDGLEVIRHIRNSRVDRDVFILVLTGEESTEVKVQALNEGANDFVLKPFVREELQARVRVARRQVLILEELRRAYSIISAEMDTVADLQNRLLPRGEFDFSGVDLDWMYLPSGKASGDYYDFFPVGSATLRFVVADVSGHGARAAFIMNTVRTIFRMSWRNYFSLEQVVGFVNDDLFQIVGGEADFVTLLACDLDLSARSLTYINAGHCPGFFLADHELMHEVLPNCRPLGIFPLDITSGELYYKDSIKAFLYTDGFYEWETAPGEILGLDRFRYEVHQMMRREDFDLNLLKTRLELIGGDNVRFRDDLTALWIRTRS